MKAKAKAEKRLFDIGKQSISIAQEVSRWLNLLRVKEPKNTWESVKVAVQSMLSKKEMNDLEKLDNLRKEINTTLLFCIR
jgi:superfamily I DNA and/or RNA helicase